MTMSNYQRDILQQIKTGGPSGSTRGLLIWSDQKLRSDLAKGYNPYLPASKEVMENTTTCTDEQFQQLKYLIHKLEFCRALRMIRDKESSPYTLYEATASFDDVCHKALSDTK